MAEIHVITPALAAGAEAIGFASNAARNAQDVVSCLSADAFGTESIANDISALLRRGSAATEAMADRLAELGANVGAASIGYVTTDAGIVPPGWMKP